MVSIVVDVTALHAPYQGALLPAPGVAFGTQGGPVQTAACGTVQVTDAAVALLCAAPSVGAGEAMQLRFEAVIGTSTVSRCSCGACT